MRSEHTFKQSTAKGVLEPCIERVLATFHFTNLSNQRPGCGGRNERNESRHKEIKHDNSTGVPLLSLRKLIYAVGQLGHANVDVQVVAKRA